MKKGKYSNGRARKPVALILALVLVLGIAIGGTIAWLTDTTEEVKNTFTVSDINITLDESDDLDLQMIPGHTIEKDPKASVTEGSEDCYLFVEVIEDGGVVTYKPAGSQTTETTEWSDFLSYEIAEGWTKLNDGVYYKIFNEDTAEQNVQGTLYSILKNDQVAVSDEVTKEMMNALANNTDEYPTLSFKAYAVQYWADNDTPFEPADAWALANP